MGIKTKKQAEEEKYIKLGFKWEFLRRNKNYIADYNSYVANCREKYKDDSISNSEYTAYKKELNNVFMKNYGIRMPLNFNISYLELKKQIRTPPSEKAIKEDWKKMENDCRLFNKKSEHYRKKFLRHRAQFLYWDSHLATAPEIPYYLNGEYKVLLLEGIIRNFISYASSVRFSVEPSHPDEIQHKTIKIAIDFSAPLSKIISDIERGIKPWYKQFRHTKKDTKLRLNNYKELLEIYDLKEKKGWSWEQLTKKYKKKHIGLAEYKYLTREIKRDYDICKKFIDGDYSQIW